MLLPQHLKYMTFMTAFVHNGELLRKEKAYISPVAAIVGQGVKRAQNRKRSVSEFSSTSAWA
jgi:hypothetical protein